jgi:nucleoside-diphosphate-sugar epimerase
VRVLVTGSSGYVGRCLAPSLKAQGHQVIGFDRRPPTSGSLDSNFRADLLDGSTLDHALHGVDSIAHLAAAKGDWGISEADYYRDNVEATRALIRASRRVGVRRWIYYSTVAVLGPSDVPLDEQAPFSPVIPYGVSKAEGEKLFAQLAGDDPSAQIIVIRPSVVFGAGNPANTNIYRLIDAIHRHRFVMVGRGTEIKTTSYVDNLIAAHIFLMDHMAPGLQTYIYVDQPALSTRELVARICRLLGKRAPRVHLPLGVVKPVAYVGDALARVTRLDLPITAARIQKFCTGTNFDPAAIHGLGFRQPVDIDVALGAAVDWYLAHTGHAGASTHAGPTPSE